MGLKMQEKNRCAFLDKEHNFKIIECEIPVPKENEILIKIVANGICGSDIHFFAEGRLGNFIVTDPYVPGHEASGTVQGIGKDVTGFITGEKVVIEPGIPCGRCKLCMSGRYNLCQSVIFFSAPPINGTFCDYICVRADFVHKVPENTPFEYAAMAEPTAVAVHAVNRAGIISGKDGLIFGVGPIGLLTLQAFKAMGGGRATCVDIIDNRLELAKKLGADKIFNAKSGEDLTNIADVVFETAGSSFTTSQIFTAVRPAGTAVQVGWPSSNMVNMNIADFIEKEITYTSINRYANAFPAAIQYISDGRINVKPLITHTFDFCDIATAFKFAKDNPSQVIKVIVKN
jgi:L-iditol 2-dehydrogenase